MGILVGKFCRLRECLCLCLIGREGGECRCNREFSFIGLIVLLIDYL